jgi:hypothetical protein
MVSLGYWHAVVTAPPLDDFVEVPEKQASRGPLESSSESMIMAYKVHAYADLLRQIRNDLRIQHPDWIQPNGESPMCDSYEARLMELLAASIESGPSEATAVPDRAFEYERAQI